MFDKIINAATSYFPNRFIAFFIAGFLFVALNQVVVGAGFDVMVMVKLALTAAVSGFLASLIIAAAGDL